MFQLSLAIFCLNFYVTEYRMKYSEAPVIIIIKMVLLKHLL